MYPQQTSQSWAGGALGLKPDPVRPVSGCPSLHSGLEAPLAILLPTQLPRATLSLAPTLASSRPHAGSPGLAWHPGSPFILSSPGGDKGHCVILRTSQTLLLIHVYINRAVAYG